MLIHRQPKLKLWGMIVALLIFWLLSLLWSKKAKKQNYFVTSFFLVIFPSSCVYPFFMTLGPPLNFCWLTSFYPSENNVTVRSQIMRNHLICFIIIHLFPLRALVGVEKDVIIFSYSCCGWTVQHNNAGGELYKKLPGFPHHIPLPVTPHLVSAL